MAAKSVRLQISVSEQVASKIDKYAEDIGVSRNAACAFLLHEGVENKNIPRDKAIIKEVSKEVSDFEN